MPGYHITKLLFIHESELGISPSYHQPDIDIMISFLPGVINFKEL